MNNDLLPKKQGVADHAHILKMGVETLHQHLDRISGVILPLEQPFACLFDHIKFKLDIVKKWVFKESHKGLFAH